MGKKDGGPAFPCGGYESGMTLRQHYAGLAMQGNVTAIQAKPVSEHNFVTVETIAEWSFRLADAMIAHEEAERAANSTENQ